MMPARGGLIYSLVLQPITKQQLYTPTLDDSQPHPGLADMQRDDFHTVFIAPNPVGVGYLAAVAAGPRGKDIRHLIIARDTVSSEDPNCDWAHSKPGPQSTFARHLAAALSNLPALEAVDIAERPGWEPMGARGSRGFGSVSTIFRGVLFALAHAHAAGVRVTRLHVLDCHYGQLDNESFSLHAGQHELVAPFLGQLRTLKIYFWRQAGRMPMFDAFLRQCTSLVELNLSNTEIQHAGGNPVLSLAEGPALLPCLEVLRLKKFQFPPATLLKLLSRWHLREVRLNTIYLDYDPVLVREHRKKLYNMERSSGVVGRGPAFTLRPQRRSDAQVGAQVARRGSNACQQQCGQ